MVLINIANYPIPQD